MNILQFLEKILNFIKSLFLNGIITILPIAATIFFLHFTYNLVARWLYPLKQIEPEFLQKIPGAEFLIVIVAILIIGFLVKFLIITPLIHHFEKVITKIPLIRTVYTSAKTLVNFFNYPSTAQVTQRVVLIEFPKKGFYNLAFLLETAQNDFQKLLPESAPVEEKKFYKVFMPNSPNPTSGYFLIIPEDEIIETNITFEEAIKAVVSCGLITPETLKNKI